MAKKQYLITSVEVGRTGNITAADDLMMSHNGNSPEEALEEFLRVEGIDSYAPRHWLVVEITNNNVFDVVPRASFEITKYSPEPKSKRKAKGK